MKRLNGENEEQYIWRIGQAKDCGDIDLNWDEIADLINKEFRNEDIEYSSSTYRKAYQQAKRFFQAGVFQGFSSKDYLNELDTKLIELKKQEIKTRDERTEYNRKLREVARKETYIEQIIRIIKEHKNRPLEYNKSKRDYFILNSNNDLVVSFSDVHTGVEIDNFCNTFDEYFLKTRIKKYLDKILEVQIKHNSENIYVILSELLSGIIHLTLRIENNQNLIEQFLTIIDYLSEFLSELSYRFKTVNVYMCQGNHSRISPNKTESINGENMDVLAIPFLEAKLQNFNNIKFGENDVVNDIAMFSVRGNTIMSSHGDKDEPKSVVQKFTMMFDIKPNLVYLFHRHRNALSTVYDTKVIESGCMSGSDQHCIDNRMCNKPEQTISVITEEGLDCIYDVKLD